MIMRDPLLLRIRHAPHYRRGDAWCLYPLYDFAHGLSDAIEGITHSLCTLEFKDNRDIYDWLVREAGFERPPEQTEFARLELDYTVAEQAEAAAAGERGARDGLGRPAHADASPGMRRRGVTPEAIRDFCRRGRRRAEADARTELATFEHAVRDDLNMRVPRVMCVAQSAQGRAHELSRRPGRASSTRRTTRTTCRRRARGRCRSRASCGSSATTSWRIRRRSSSGSRRAARCGSAMATSSPARTSSRTRRATSSSCAAPTIRRRAAATRPTAARCRARSTGCRPRHALDCEVRLYDRLFTVPDPDAVDEGQDFTAALNPESLVVVHGAKIEPSVADGSGRVRAISSSGPATS